MFKSAVCSTLFFSTVALATGGTPVLDGTLDASAGYTSLAVALPSDKVGSFGATCDASAIYYTHDATHVYFFIQGKLPANSLPGIVFLLNTSAQTGVPAGTDLSALSSGDHVFSPFTGATNWKADFEVDWGYALWLGNTVHRCRYVAGARAGDFVGTSTGSGTAGDSNGSTRFAVNHSGISTGPGTSTGWELALSRAGLGNPTAADTVQAFAVIANNSASFSQDSVPANLSADPGTNPDFGTIPGNQSTTAAPLPVSVSIFALD